jgi:hypothetical protein
MSKNVTVDSKGKSLNQLAEEDPELMRLWGEINNAWDDIERLLYVAFDAMLAEEVPFATHAIFYSQTSHAARRTMVEALAKYALLNRPTTARNLDNAIRRVKARADDRHRLAHGTWAMGVVFATGENGLLRMAPSADIVPNPKNDYPRKRLTSVRDEMRDTARALREAIEPIESAKRAKAIELGKRHMEKSRILEPKVES